MTCDTLRALCDPKMLTFCKEGGTQLLEGLDFDKFSINNSMSKILVKFKCAYDWSISSILDSQHLQMKLKTLS